MVTLWIQEATYVVVVVEACLAVAALAGLLLWACDYLPGGRLAGRRRWDLAAVRAGARRALVVGVALAAVSCAIELLGVGLTRLVPGAGELVASLVYLAMSLTLLPGGVLACLGGLGGLLGTGRPKC
jgi:hypothetical protein